MNRLDRGAVLISTLWQGRVAAVGERDHRRSGKKAPGFFLLGRQRTSAGLSQKLCEALSLADWLPLLGLSRTFHGPLTKAVHFLFYWVTPKKERSIEMKKLFSLMLALAVMLSLAVPAIAEDVPSGVEDGVLTIAMECAYAPYNWT